MAASTARAATTHWFIPGAAAVAIHVAALSWSVFLAPLSPDSADTDAVPVEYGAIFHTAELEPEEHETRGESSHDDSSASVRGVVPTSPQRSVASQTPSKPSVAVARPRLTPSKAPNGTPVRDAEPKTSADTAGTEHAAAPSTSLPGGATPVAGGTSTTLAGGSTGKNAAGFPQGDTGTNHEHGSKPRLLSSGVECQGVLSGSALTSPTKVTLVLRVAKDGSASTTAVRADSRAHIPGLESAAQRCAQRLRFAPARSEDGSAVVSSSIVKLTFSNHYTANLSARATSPRRNSI